MTSSPQVVVWTRGQPLEGGEVNEEPKLSGPRELLASPILRTSWEHLPVRKQAVTRQGILTSDFLPPELCLQVI